MLARRELRQLAQRVTARYHIGPLNRAETEAYVQHRIQVAGGLGKVAFTKGALAAVHAVSKGVPRVLNLVCDRALLAGYARGARTIDAPTVRLAAREVQGVGPRLDWRGVAAAAVAAVVALLGAGALASLRSSPAIPAPKPAAAVSPAPAPPLRLGGLVLRAPREAATQASFESVRTLWGPEPLERTSLRANRDMLRRLDLPAILEMFHPERTDTVPLALLGLQGEQAIVSLLGETARVSWTEVDALWTRQATFLWRDSERLLQDPTRAETWLQGRLLELRYAQPGASGALALQAFQRDLGLVPDGLLGVRTLMALVTRGSAPRPRLGATS
jgi:general secretion pathway protein A